LALVRNAPPVTFSRLPFAESRKPLVRVRLAGSHGPVDPGHRTARQRGLIVVIFDPAPLGDLCSEFFATIGQAGIAELSDRRRDAVGAHLRMRPVLRCVFPGLRQRLFR
jgi:hypothetical protein